MVWKSLILGVVFSIGVFAVKCGVGLQYYILKTASKKKKAGVVGLYALAYLLLFLGSRQALVELDLTKHLAAVMAFMESGMVVHLLMALALALWGIKLLREEKSGRPASRGWLLLVVPCPVCAVVVFMSLGFLIALFPESSWTAALSLFATFILVSGLTLLTASFGGHRSETPPETVLGAAMLLISVYFLLSVTLMPQFADADKIHRLSMSSTDAASRKLPHLVAFAFCVAATFASGFGFTFTKQRRKP